jgi:hypothetical protein
MSVATFFGPIVPAICNCYNVTGPGGTVPESGAAWGCVLQVLQNLMNFAVSLGAIIITLYIVWAGVAYVLSPINAEGRQKAKSRLLNAVLGLFVMLAAWLFIDSIMKVIYNSNAYGPWNSILNPNGAADCIAPTIFTPSANIANNNSNGGPGVTTAPTPTTPTSSGSGGACNASNVQAAAAAGGQQISTSESQVLACIAAGESSCGVGNLNYNWGKGSSAAGAFQLLMQTGSQDYNNPACAAAAGVPNGTLNCAAGFSGGNPIPGSAIATECENAAANLNCSATAAAEAVQQNGYRPWLPTHQNCVTQYGGS